MRQLNSQEVIAVSGASIALNDFVDMLNSGMSLKKIAQIGLESANAQEKTISFFSTEGVVAGESGHYFNTGADGSLVKIKWFFDGAGYLTSISKVA